MGISTSTGTLTAGQSRTFNLSPASAVTLTLLPNVRVTITETPATVVATGLGGNATRVHEPRLPGSFTYGPYPMGGAVVVENESNSGSTVTWVETNALGGVVNATGVDDPVQLPSAAVGSAGALTGSYYYAFTYVTADGSETAPSTGTGVVVSPSSQRVNLTGILVGPDSSVVARKLYRTTGSPADVKDYYYLATINDNTTTTYEDNATDGTLGDPVSWISTVKGSMSIGGSRVANFLNQSTTIGEGANAGYASTSIGFEAGKSTTSGRRNVGIGTYALTSLTSGYENTGIGVHAGQNITVASGNTFIGYRAGYNTGNATKSSNNVAIGVNALVGTSYIGNTNVAVGYRALSDINTADQCVGLGYAAGKYANASRQVFIDNIDRANIANCQNIGLIYGKGETTAVAQILHFNALTRVGPPSLTVSSLPAAVAGYTGYRAFVTDANATTFATVVAGGGANGVPVYCDGTNWRIG